MNMNDYKTPGQLIEDLLRERGWTQRVLAAVLEMSESTTNKLISGDQAITAKIAILLEEVLGVSAQKFLSLQRDYDLACARLVSRPNPTRLTRAYLFNGLPIAEMIRRRWLETNDVRDIPSVEKSLTKFFGVDNLNEIEILPHAAKKTVVSGDATAVQIAWLYRVKEIAAEMIVGKYSNFGVRRAIELLRPLLVSAEAVEKVPRILADCGIRFLIVESLPSAKIDGVCFWLDGDAPVIGMTLRFDRIDNFWFVLRHELEHVLHEHGKAVISIDSDIDSVAGINEEERIANDAASEFCVPRKKMDSFIARKSPLFSERDIRSVAATLKIHPGLVAGQLRHRINRHDLFASHLVKIRSIITPNAVVDGWGDVAHVESIGAHCNG